jgi:hypothetical protein
VSDATSHEWWGQLRHDGVLVSPQLLDEFFPTLAELPERDYDRLRDAWLTFEAATDTSAAKRDYTEAVLQRFCGLVGWQKGNQVAARFKATSRTGQKLRPDWILTDDSGEQGLVAVTFDDASRLGIGRGKRAFARTVDLLRATGVSFAILTNGQQFRLIHAGPDFAAWTEWDAAAWFDEAEGREQLRGLRALLGHGSLVSPAEGTGLLAAVRASRHRQGDLAQVLGEQVRQAIEHVIDALDGGLRSDPELLRQVHKDPRTGQDIGEAAVLQALYQAATRIAMRLVVLLYAEARELFPRSNELYHQSYGVDALYQQLTRAAQHAGGLGALADRTNAWSRLLALFRIVHEGSPHQDLPIRDYGGTLFRRGDLEEVDPVLRALAVLEQQGPNDATVLRILRLLKIGKVKVRKGRTTAWVSGPVDFSDLRTEYIGIIYEGLLDFELKRAPDEDAIIFLNLGRQPALPLARLEGMSDKQVKELISELRKDKAAAGATSEDNDQTEEADDSSDDEAQTEEAGELEPELDDAGDEALRQRGAAWAERAVEVARLVRRTKNMSSSEHARRRAEAGRGLIERVIGPQQLYLATWGGLRKGTGTFYTRPALAVPTTQRTLEPLCYVRTDDELKPRTPEEILDLKVCDPAMGSGSFLVAAVRYLTDALAHALHAHGRIGTRDDRTIITLPLGHEATGAPLEELLPVPPDDDRFDSLLRARLARHVVERCIYGVDINPMAVELARLALWVETLDRELPFEFLDHKLKAGNSLVGSWVNLSQDYPAKAWDRESGDGRSGEQTKWLKDTIRERVKPELKDLLDRRAGAVQLPGFGEIETDPLESVVDLRERLAAIHELPGREEREAAYGAFLASDEYTSLKSLLDRWSAVWFWPADEKAREPALTPDQWAQPTPVVSDRVEELAADQGFFHWELEFADVFHPTRRGFDAIVGNPPWDIAKPNSQEFFSSHDPLYRTYSKQTALRRQRELFEASPSVESDWIAYQAGFKAMSNWVKSSEDPFDVSVAHGKAGTKLKERWAKERANRSAVANRTHPYRYQGAADLNTYKMFLELAHHLLRDGGRLGFVVPSGIWTDKGATDLRRLFIDGARWEWCYGFENRHKIFPIDSRVKFAPVIVQRGGRTETIRAAFMRHDVGEWEQPEPPALDVDVDDVKRFSPNTFSLLEIREDRDLEITEKIYGSHPLLGNVVSGVHARYSAEFHMTNDSKLFVATSKLKAAGHLGPGEDTRDPRVRARLRVSGYLPLYEGKSLWINQPYFDPITKFVEPDSVTAKAGENWQMPRLAARNIGSSTNQRSLVCSLLPAAGHGNSVPSLDGLTIDNATLLCALLSSLTIDYVLRMRVSANINWFHLEELPVATVEDIPAQNLVWRLNALSWDYGSEAQDALIDGEARMAARLLLDAKVASLYGLESADVEHIAARFPIYDKSAGMFAYPRLVPQVYRAFCLDGEDAAEREARALTAERNAAGFDFGLDEVYVPDGGWEAANAEARQILEAG